MNKTVKKTHECKERGLYFKPGLDWDRLCLLAVDDSSHAGEEELLEDRDAREPFRSQGGNLLFLSDRDIGDAHAGTMHCISFGSTTIRCVCRVTVQAETYQLQFDVETGDLMRAAVADLYNQLDERNCEVLQPLSCR